MQIPAGFLIDYFGYKKVSTYGLLTAGTGSIILGLAPNTIFEYSGRFLVGAVAIVISIIIAIFTKNSPTEYGYEPLGNEVKSIRGDVSNSIKNVIRIKEVWRGFFILFTLVGCTMTITGLWGIDYLTAVYNIDSKKASFVLVLIIYGLASGSLFVDKATKIFKDNIIIYPRIAATINTIIWIYILIIRKGLPSLI